MQSDELQRFDLTFLNILRKMDGAIPAEWHSSLASQVNQIRALLSEYQLQAAEVMQSSDNSAQGKSRRLSELGRQYATKLGSHRRVLAEYDQRITVEQAKLNGSGAKSRDDVLLSEMRAQEIRRWAREMDPLTLTTQYLSMASDTRRHDVMRAIEDAPLPLLDDATISQGRSQRVKHLAPEQVRIVEDLAEMRNVVRDALASAEAVITPNGDDPVARTASGTGNA